LQKKVPLNSSYFIERMKHSGWEHTGTSITKEELLSLLEDRFSAVDFQQLKSDVAPFIKDSHALSLWNKEFFTAVSRDGLVVG
jgi:hypothetical protein